MNRLIAVLRWFLAFLSWLFRKLEEFHQHKPGAFFVIGGIAVAVIAGILVALLAPSGQAPKDISIAERALENSGQIETDAVPSSIGQTEEPAELQPLRPAFTGPGGPRCQQAPEVTRQLRRLLDSNVSPCVSRRRVELADAPYCADQAGIFEIRADFSITGEIFEDTSIVRVCYRGSNEFDIAEARYRLISGNLRSLCEIRGHDTGFLSSGCR